MKNIFSYLTFLSLVASSPCFAQSFAKDTSKPKKLADNLVPVPPMEPSAIPKKSGVANTTSLDKKMENAFKGVDPARVVKKKVAPPNKNLPKSAQDPNALSVGNFKVSEYLFAEHSKMIVDYVDKYHKNHGPRMSRIKARNKGYFSMIDKTLRKNGVPVEFHSLAVIESALNPNACSPVGAVGPWQFMAPTAMMFGLKVTDSIDERTDFIKSTWAASKYCKRLHNMFHDWLLVVASYNCGPAPVLRALKKTDGKSFWDIKHMLPKETQNHVMAFIATSAWFDKNTKVLDMGYLPKNSKPIELEKRTDLAPLTSVAKKSATHGKVVNKGTEKNATVTTNSKHTEKKLSSTNKSDVAEKDDELELVDEAPATPKSNLPMPVYLGTEKQNVVTLKIKGEYNLQAVATILDIDLDALSRWNPMFNEKAKGGKEYIFLTIPNAHLDAFLLQKDKILTYSRKNPFATTPVIKVPVQKAVTPAKASTTNPKS